VLCTCSFGIVATLIVRHVSLKLALSSLIVFPVSVALK